MSSNGHNPTRNTPFEWPTIAVVIAIYGGFGWLSWHHHTFPWWVVAVLGGYLVAWHGSLQHEVVHGHPTRWSWLNELLVFPSLWLWMPFQLYRQSHLAHHATDELTDPRLDPESYYLSAETWRGIPRWKRLFLTWHNTLLGRLVLGPPAAVWSLLHAEARRLFDGDTSHRRFWPAHLLGCGVTLFWVLWVCEIHFLEYVLLYVYPGISLTLLRSFAEHRADLDPAKRTAIIESRGPLSLLYLGNNLHVVHHQQPALPWYRLRPAYEAQQGALLEHNGGYRFRGYGAVARQYLLRPKEPVPYPLDRAKTA